MRRGGACARFAVALALTGACGGADTRRSTQAGRSCLEATQPTTLIGLVTDLGFIKVIGGWSILATRVDGDEPMYILSPPAGRTYRIIIRAMPRSAHSPTRETMADFLRTTSTELPWPPSARPVRLGYSPDGSAECLLAETARGVLASCGAVRGAAIVHAQMRWAPRSEFERLGGLELLYAIAASADDIEFDL